MQYVTEVSVIVCEEGVLQILTERLPGYFWNKFRLFFIDMKWMFQIYKILQFVSAICKLIIILFHFITYNNFYIVWDLRTTSSTKEIFPKYCEAFDPEILYNLEEIFSLYYLYSDKHNYLTSPHCITHPLRVNHISFLYLR